MMGFLGCQRDCAMISAAANGSISISGALTPTSPSNDLRQLLNPFTAEWAGSRRSRADDPHTDHRPLHGRSVRAPPLRQASTQFAYRWFCRLAWMAGFPINGPGKRACPCSVPLGEAPARGKDRRPWRLPGSCADFLVELRGFEPLTFAVPAPTRLTGSSLPFLGGSSATSATANAIGVLRGLTAAGVTVGRGSGVEAERPSSFASAIRHCSVTIGFGLRRRALRPGRPRRFCDSRRRLA
jgi:hypothetical protein